MSTTTVWNNAQQFDLLREGVDKGRANLTNIEQATSSMIRFDTLHYNTCRSFNHFLWASSASIAEPSPKLMIRRYTMRFRTRCESNRILSTRIATSSKLECTIIILLANLIGEQLRSPGHHPPCHPRNQAPYPPSSRLHTGIYSAQPY